MRCRILSFYTTAHDEAYMTPQEMVVALLEQGMTQTGIARQIGVSQPTVWRVMNGADVFYSTGVRLRQLYDKQRRKKHKA